VDFQPGGLLGGLLGGGLNLGDPGSLLAGWVPFFRNDIGPTLLLLFIGGVVLVVGLGKLGKEPPVQVVVGPMESAAKGAMSTGKKAAELAAVAA
jgi:hypothetical protein